MDSIDYKNIIEYTTPLEITFLFAKNTDRFECSCGKMITKVNKWSHWKGKNHKMISESKLHQEKKTNLCI